jgi:type II secretory ATPase GspE/PulE/Tfp pilus assembly ATPase PilB-like protein
MFTNPSPPGDGSPHVAAVALLGDLSGLDTLDELLAAAQLRIAEAFGAEHAIILTLESGPEQLCCSCPEGLELVNGQIPPRLLTIARVTSRTRRTFNIRDATDLEELKRHAIPVDPTARAAMATGLKQVVSVPLLLHEYFLGVLMLVNRTEGLAFPPEAIVELRKLASSLGMLLANFSPTTDPAARTKARPGRYDLLISEGLLSAEDLQRVEGKARRERVSVDELLVGQMGVSKAQLLESIAAFHGVEAFHYDGQDEPELADLVGSLNTQFLLKHQWVPVGFRDGALRVAVEDPGNLAQMDALRSANLATRVEIVVATRSDIMQMLADWFGATPGDEEAITEEAEEEDDPAAELGVETEAEPGEDADGGPDEEDSEIVRLANRIIRDAHQMGVSDIHVEPNGAREDLVIRFRKDGECFIHEHVSPRARAALVSRLKIMARLDIAERRRPQDGKIRFRTQGGILELRVATIPTSGQNEDIVMRLLAASKPLALDQMGFSPRNVAEWSKLIAKPYGLCLAVGPTGSGKTTTLHSSLGHINEPKRKIWTAEDPVEITQAGLRQVQVHPKIGLTFAAALRSFLRLDPDVIMIGEMRDHETAQMGIEASLTGHLVFSTLHTNSAPETVTRLLDMQIDPFTFGDALLGVMAQRLVRTLCKTCSKDYLADQDEVDALQRAFGEEAFRAAKLFPGKKPPKLRRATGCEDCLGTGVRGRMAVHELLVCTDELRTLIFERSPMTALQAQAARDGMESLLQDGVRKVLAGKSTLSNVLAVCMK